MLRYLHGLSATLFYVLAGGMFLAYVFYHNNIAVAWTRPFLYAGQLPLFIVGVLYGGLSVYRSLTDDAGHSRGLAIVIGVPLMILFVTFLVLRFT